MTNLLICMTLRYMVPFAGSGPNSSSVSAPLGVMVKLQNAPFVAPFLSVLFYYYYNLTDMPHLGLNLCRVKVRISPMDGNGWQKRGLKGVQLRP